MYSDAFAALRYIPEVVQTLCYLKSEKVKGDSRSMTHNRLNVLGVCCFMMTGSLFKYWPVMSRQ